MPRDCVLMHCDCRGAGPALRDAIHERDRSLFDNRQGVAQNSPNSEMLEEVVHFIEDDDMTVEELEERIDMVLGDWADLGVSLA